MAAKTGILVGVDFSTELNLDLSAFTRQVFVNETPFISRTRRVKGSAEKFSIISYSPRPRTGYQLNGAIADTTGTTFTLDDASQLMVGDILEVGTERICVTELTSATAIKASRGYAGTTAATQADNSILTLIGNARLGNEVDQVANRAPRTVADQYHQRLQYPVQVGGGAMDVTNIELPNGYSNPFDMQREEKLVEMMREAEYTCYYGKAQAPSSTVRRATAGIRNLGINLTTAADISDEAAYTPDSLVRDLFQKIFDGGGQADVCFVSTGFMSGLHKWGYAKTTNFNLGQNKLGVNIQGYVIPFNGRDVTFIPSLQLGSATNHTAFAITSEEVSLSYLRPESWSPRGRRGDAFEGDWLFDIAPKLVNPLHHAWVEGITAFS